MNKEKRLEVLSAFHRALLFNITINTRLIFADVENANKLIIWVYLDKPPTNDEKDVYFSVSGEVIGDFVELDQSISEVHFITEDLNEEYLKSKMLLFARCDYLDAEGNLKPD